MKLDELVLEKVKGLPPDKQQEVLDFAEFLKQKCTVKRPRRSLEGLWADFHIDITDDDIAAARLEMWGTFPREDVL
jgi:hypothetical protein